MSRTLFGELLLEKPDDGFGWFMFLFGWFIVLLIFGGILWGTLYLVDSTNLSNKQGTATVERMYYRPSHYVTTYVKSGNVLIPLTTFHDEEWHVCFNVDGLTDDVTVYKKYYEVMQEGQTVDVTYSIGRIWDSMYIKNFSLKP